MRIVIIEDEELMAEDLADTIRKIIPDAHILTILDSVRSATSWFQKNEQPDLIFSDIQLGDGLSFEIFKTISDPAPIIFCTAFNEYALKAFDANGIDYLLKPFDEKAIKESYQKYIRLKDKLSGNTANLDQIMNLFESKMRQAKSSVLVYKQDKIFPIRFDDIALFYIENEITHLLTFDNKRYSVNQTIEKLEAGTPDTFFRVNRQFLVNRKAVKEASQYFARKLSLHLTIPFEETITVSKNRVSDFLNWLSEH